MSDQGDGGRVDELRQALEIVRSYDNAPLLNAPGECMKILRAAPSLLRELGDTRAENDELRETLGARTRHNDRLIRHARRLDAELIAGLSTDEHQMTMLAGLPTCRCGFPLGGGDATGTFITHALDRIGDTRARLAAVKAVPAANPEWSEHYRQGYDKAMSRVRAALGATDG